MKNPPLFLQENASTQEPTTTMQIEGAEAEHAIKARRLGIDDRVAVTDGRGLLVLAKVIECKRKPAQVIVEVIESRKEPIARHRLLVASAIPKGDRMATMLDMLTQLGISGFIPIDCEFSSVKYQDKMLERWRRITTSALKQSRRTWLPELFSGITLDTLLTRFPADTQFVYGDPDAQGYDQITTDNTATTVVIIGPEGGFSEREMLLLSKHQQCHAVCIAPHILRTETAAISLAAVCISAIAD